MKISKSQRPPILKFTGAEGDNAGIHYAGSQELTLWLETLHSHFSIFFTKEGYIGLGGKGTMPGDNIHIIPGCDIPLVLRNCSNSYELPTGLDLHESSEEEDVEETDDKLSSNKSPKPVLKKAEAEPNFELETKDEDHWLISECCKWFLQLMSWASPLTD